MSTEQDKDSFSLKTHRGGDAGLDGLGSAGLLLASPDKKKRKLNPQAQLFAPLSEYAPPPNPSSDHLVASNPFDDNYDNSPAASLKPFSAANPYFSPAPYAGFCAYGPPRTVTHIQNRMPAPFGSPFQIRNQPHPFVQNPAGPMGFNRTPVFTYGHPENLAFATQPVFNAAAAASRVHQHFRPSPGENLNPLSLSNVNQNHGPDLMFGPGVTTGAIRFAAAPKPGPDTSPGLNFPPPTAPKQEAGESGSKNVTPPRKPGQLSEEGGAREREAGLKGRHRSIAEGVEKINGVLHHNTEALKKSPHAGAENSGERNRRPAANKSGPANSKRGRVSGSAPSEPVYPCGICLGEVNDDQEAILCEASCQKWFHRVCTGMTETAYNLLTAEAAAVWGCDSCVDDKDAAQLLKTREASGSATPNSQGQT